MRRQTCELSAPLQSMKNCDICSTTNWKSDVISAFGAYQGPMAFSTHDQKRKVVDVDDVDAQVSPKVQRLISPIIDAFCGAAFFSLSIYVHQQSTYISYSTPAEPAPANPCKRQIQRNKRESHSEPQS